LNTDFLAIDSSYAFTYTFTDELGCTKDTTVNMTVFGKPNVEVLAFDSYNCQLDSQEIEVYIDAQDVDVYLWGEEGYIEQTGFDSRSYILKKAGPYALEVFAENCSYSEDYNLPFFNENQIEYYPCENNCETNIFRLCVRNAAPNSTFQATNGVIGTGIPTVLSRGDEGVWKAIARAPNGCVSEAYFQLDSFERPIPSVNADSSSRQRCNSLKPGHVLLGAYGGVMPKSVEWTTDTGNIIENGDTNTPLVNGVGTYYYNVTNLVTGCSSYDSTFIHPAIDTNVYLSYTDITCEPGLLSIDSLDFSVYELSITPEVSELDPTNFLISNPDTYELFFNTVYCEIRKTVEVNQLDPISIITNAIDIDSLTHLNSIDVSVFGGTAPYEYTWTDANGNSISSFQDLANVENGFYTLNVIDATGCFRSESYLLSSSSLYDHIVSKLRVYPNPFNNEINIESDYFDSGTVHIYNEQGQIVGRREWVNGASIDVTDLMPGQLYFFKIQNGLEVQTFKAIKG
jgi:hypothetical protein